MKVFLRPLGLHSRAMLRVAEALRKRLPAGWTEVAEPEQADLQILHVIGPDALGQVKAPRYAVIQYCTNLQHEVFAPMWERADAVWSYYDLRQWLPKHVPFFYAPLGVDEAFIQSSFRAGAPREIDIMTSGTTTGPTAEAIQEVAMAAEQLRLKVLHIGPKHIEGATEEFLPASWQAQEGMDDKTLAMLYRNSRRVSGLRHVEGFELPCLEGLLCGARPVVFDRPEMRKWYGDLVEYVPECHGEKLIERFVDLLSGAPRPVTVEERDHVLTMFSWDNLVPAFWQLLEEPVPQALPIQVSETRRRLLWVGDAVQATGFARSTHRICDALQPDYEIHILGVNYYGDPHDYPYKIYPASTGGDMLGIGRLKGLVQRLSPAAVVLQTDPWFIQSYLKEAGETPTIGFVAIDGKNPDGKALNGLTRAVFWTEFAREEAAKRGYRGPGGVVHLGVDLDLYRPQDKLQARAWLGEALRDRGLAPDCFMVGFVGRNQWRKRVDLLMDYFAEWIHSRGIKDAVLWLHSAPSMSDEWNLGNMAQYFGIQDRVLRPSFGSNGLPEKRMSEIYAQMDVFATTTLGEGFGLPVFEAMASGVPVVVPDWSALGEFCAGAGMLVPCTSVAVHPQQTETVGGVADKQVFVEALDRLYRDRHFAMQVGAAGLRRVKEDRFRWPNIAKAFAAEINAALTESRELIAAGH